MGIRFGFVEVFISEIVFRVKVDIKSVPFIALRKRVCLCLIGIILFVESFIGLFVEIRVFHAQIIDLSFVLVF